SMAPTRPVSSSTVSPFAFRATTNAAIWAGVAWPASTSVNAAAASSASRSPPASRRRRTADQPPRSARVVTAGQSGGRERPVTAGSTGSTGSAGSGRAAPLADDAPPLALGRAAPHAFLLPAREGVLEAGLADDAHGADRLGLLGVVVVGRIEDL